MDEDEVASILGESSGNGPPPARAPCPRRGENRDFDRYFDGTTADYDPTEVDFQELRRAAWATWRTRPPAALGRTDGNDGEDDELARALALSVEDYVSQPGPRPATATTSAYDGDEDEELRRAIAMSVEDSRAPKRQKREETPEEERRMLAEAMAASLAESTPETSSAPPVLRKAALTDNISSSSQTMAPLSVPPSAGPSNSASPAPSVDPTPPTVLRVGGQVIDRAQLERERRERQAAREAASSSKGPGSGSVTTHPVTSYSSNTRPSGPAKIAGISSLTSNGGSEASTSRAGPSSVFKSASTPDIHPLQSSGPFPSDAAGEYFLDGELRHTALTIGDPTEERTFAPKEVVGKHSQISLVIMSSFVIDDQWIMERSILPPPEVVPTITVRPHPKDKQEYNGKIQLQPNGEMWVYPKMTTGFGSAHMKYFWIIYKTGRLRVVISTANMVDYDWERIENTIFVQDFLPLSTPNPLREDHTPHDFPLQFSRLFTHTRVHTALRHLIHNHPSGSSINFKPDDNFANLAKYDWSKVRVRLVMSVPGSYAGHEEVDRYGISRLGKVLNEQGWVPKSGEKLDVEFQGSSLGTYSLEWFDKFYSFISGKTSQQLVNRPKPSSWPFIRILFPSLDTVEKSQLGKSGGGTMFCGKAFNSVTRPLFHDANSKRGGVLMHTKMLIAIFAPVENRLGVEKSATRSKAGKRKADEIETRSDGDGVGGWIYVGSHNFSPSAWGNVDVKKKPPTLNIKNYELGIVFPMDRGNARAVADRVAPYKRPAKKYSAGDVPWDQHAHE